MADDKKKYKYMENVLNDINKKFLSLPDPEVKRNNEILDEFLKVMVPKMQEIDSLFKRMYTRVFYGGSYYDGLRVGEPSEFDLDLLLALPKLLKVNVSNSDLPAYLNVKFENFTEFVLSDVYQQYKGLEQLINLKTFYLETGKVLRWMEGLVQKAVEHLPRENNKYVIDTKHGRFYVRVCKSGPAFTLKANGIIGGKHVSLDVDLVPCFVFTQNKWPKGAYRKNPVSTKTDFFIVPKPLKGANTDHYWRLSFQEQERVLISGKRALKPTVKLLKKMRDKFNHKCIASYYIKTVVLWQLVDGKRDDKFWENSLSYVFMTILKEYHKHLQQKSIPYFWNKNYNLIDGVSSITASNMANKIKAIIDDIDKHPNDPYIVAKHVLTQREFQQLYPNVDSQLTAAVSNLLSIK